MRRLENGETIEVDDTICVLTRGEITYRAKVKRVTQRYAYTEIHVYPRVYGDDFKNITMWDHTIVYVIERE